MTIPIDVLSTKDHTPFTVTFEDRKTEYNSQMSALSDRDPGAGSSHNSPDLACVQALMEIHENEKSELRSKPSSLDSSSATTISVKTSVTFGGQVDLSPLPVPPLACTLQKFLKSIEALDQDPEQSKAIVNEFLSGDGPKLQELLVEYDRKGRETGEIGSYVEEFWNDSYLAPDSSVVMNLNPFFVLVCGVAVAHVTYYSDDTSHNSSFCASF